MTALSRGLAWLVAALAAAGCSTPPGPTKRPRGGGPNDARTVAPAAPAAPAPTTRKHGRILFPPGHAQTDAEALTFRGQRGPGVTEVRLNGRPAKLEGARWSLDVPLASGVTRVCMEERRGDGPPEEARCLRVERTATRHWQTAVAPPRRLAPQPTDVHVARICEARFFAVDAKRARLLIPNGQAITTWDLRSSEQRDLRLASPAPWTQIGAVHVDDTTDTATVLSASAPFRVFSVSLRDGTWKELLAAARPGVTWVKPYQVIRSGSRLWVSGYGTGPPFRSQLVRYDLAAGRQKVVDEGGSVMTLDTARGRLVAEEGNRFVRAYDADSMAVVREVVRDVNAPDNRSELLAYDAIHDVIAAGGCTTLGGLHRVAPDSLRTDIVGSYGETAVGTYRGIWISLRTPRANDDANVLAFDPTSKKYVRLLPETMLGSAPDAAKAAPIAP